MYVRLSYSNKIWFSTMIIHVFRRIFTDPTGFSDLWFFGHPINKNDAAKNRHKLCKTAFLPILSIHWSYYGVFAKIEDFWFGCLHLIASTHNREFFFEKKIGKFFKLRIKISPKVTVLLPIDISILIGFICTFYFLAYCTKLN